MAEQLESLKDTFRECGREAVVAQLGSCPQKVLRATAKAAGLPQKVSGRYLGTIELRQNILEHVLASRGGSVIEAAEILQVNLKVIS